MNNNFSNTLSELDRKKNNLCVLGLGYVGLPLAYAFSEYYSVIGFDVDENKIKAYKNGIDATNELGNEKISKSTIIFSNDINDLIDSMVYIVAVPTPINQDKTPDLNPIIEVTKMIGKYLKVGSIVIYESTVYPGLTETLCIPLLEQESNLKIGQDFKVGYSPERINPSDRINTLDKIVKIVSANDDLGLEIVDQIYSKIVKVGTHRVSSIKVAEAAKVVENSQRDVNIAFMNELAMVFNSMKIDTQEVIDAMNTKWNALGFKPGLVGGHCIGVDPYYFLYESERLGHHSQLIISSRLINNSIPKFVTSELIRLMSQNGLKINTSKIGILGLTFKEDCPDYRNSKVFEIYELLESYGASPIVVDPWVDQEVIKKEFGINVRQLTDLKDLDVVVVAVGHTEFKKIGIKQLNDLYNTNSPKILIDIKSVYNLSELKQNNFIYWRL